MTTRCQHCDGPLLVAQPGDHADPSPRLACLTWWKTAEATPVARTAGALTTRPPVAFTGRATPARTSVQSVDEVGYGDDPVDEAQVTTTIFNPAKAGEGRLGLWTRITRNGTPGSDERRA